MPSMRLSRADMTNPLENSNSPYKNDRLILSGGHFRIQNLAKLRIRTFLSRRFLQHRQRQNAVVREWLDSLHVCNVEVQEQHIFDTVSRRHPAPHAENSHAVAAGKIQLERDVLRVLAILRLRIGRSLEDDSSI